MLDGSVVDVVINDGTISEIGSSLKVGEIIDGKKNLLIPGLVDLHTHLREPGREDSETVATGIKGGGATKLTFAPSFVSNKTLLRATLECRISPTIPTFSPAKLS